MLTGLDFQACQFETEVAQTREPKGYKPMDEPCRHARRQSSVRFAYAFQML